jgi:uncharacterized protein
MKTSRYNTLFQTEDGARLAFNAMSSGFATLTPEQYEEAQKILDDPDGYRCETEDAEKLREDLIKGRFIIDDNVDELKILKVRDYSERYNTDSMTLTICPTLTCNFNCLYCYQSQFTFQKMVKEALNVRMTDGVKSGLIKYVKGRADKLRSFHAEWYGGEPLLCSDTIVGLSSEFKKICESSGCLYTSGLVTNGYALDERAMVQLKEAGVEAALITLDGPAIVHDRRRPLKNGKGTFDVVLDNLKRATEIFTGVDVRVNVDKTNFDSMPEFLDILEENGLKRKIRISFIPLEFDMNAQDGITRICWAIPEFGEPEIALSEMGMSKGFKIINLLKVNPRSGSRLCSAIKQSNYVVDPNGNLHKCLGEVGDAEDRIGYVDEEGGINLNYKAMEWLAWSPFDNADCMRCSVLPICRGGCMFNQLMKQIKGERYVFKKSGRCATIKANMPKMLELYYHAIMNRRGMEDVDAGDCGQSLREIQAT